jgi:hypothetical protein
MTLWNQLNLTLPASNLEGDDYTFDILGMDGVSNLFSTRQERLNLNNTLKILAPLLFMYFEYLNIVINFTAISRSQVNSPHPQRIIKNSLDIWMRSSMNILSRLAG